MLYRDICKILALVVLGFTGTLLVPLILGIYYEFIADPQTHPQPHTTLYFVESIAIGLALAGILQYFSRGAAGRIYRREGLAIVVFIWVLIPALGALPFYLSGTLKNPFEAYFESASGLTTTGMSAIQAKNYDAKTGQEIPYELTVQGPIPTTYRFYGNVEPVRDPVTHQIVAEGVEAVGKALLFWRSFIQWLGGVGIVVLFVAVLPTLGAGGKVLFQAEVPGPIKDALTPRIKETAVNLWKIYLGLTVFLTFLLMVTNPAMEWFDAITITFSSLSTGGFSVRNTSIGYYKNAATDWVVILSMLLGSINFSIYYYALKGKIYRIFEPEFFLYLAILTVSCALAIWWLVGTPEVLFTEAPHKLFDLSDAVRHGTFQIVSAMSSTGFTTADYDIWPYAVQALMLVLMFVGGMSGSTAGGIKIMRHYMLFRIGQFKVESLFSPKRVQTFKVGGKEMDQGAMIMVLCFFLMIISVSVAGTLLYIFNGIDPETALGLVACMVNDTGMAFRAVGPLDSCAFMTNFDYALSSVLMIMGRLEFFAIFALLVPAFWKTNE